MKILVYCQFSMFMLIAFCVFGCNQPYDLGVNIQDHLKETQLDNEGAIENEATRPDPTEARPLKPPESIEVGDLDAELPIIGDVESPEQENGEDGLNLEGLGALLPDVEVPVSPMNGANEGASKDNDPPEITSSTIEDGAENVGRNNLIRITFNESIIDGSLRLRIKNGDRVETRTNYGTQMVHLERLGRGIVMKPLTTYVIEGTVSDAAGNETEVDITFTTGEGNF